MKSLNDIVHEWIDNLMEKYMPDEYKKVLLHILVIKQMLKKNKRRLIKLKMILNGIYIYD